MTESKNDKRLRSIYVATAYRGYASAVITGQLAKPGGMVDEVEADTVARAMMVKELQALEDLV